MSDTATKEEAIRELLQGMMNNVMGRVMKSDQFIYDKWRAEKPLYDALVPHEIFKGSHFERRFTTSFGKIWQNLAEIIGQRIRGLASTEKTITGQIPIERLNRINATLAKLEHKGDQDERARPDWDKELQYIMEGAGEMINTTVICDLYVEDTKSKERFAFEIKAPLPNSDQTKVSKEKIFKLYAMEPRQVDNAYYTLPYNPYGKKEAYGWSFPMRWFDMKKDKVVLIGDEFWDLVGGPGTLGMIIGIANELGEEYKKTIRKDYLEIEEED